MPELIPDRVYQLKMRDGSPYDDGPATLIAKTDERDMEGSVVWMARRVVSYNPLRHEILYVYEDEIARPLEEG